MEGKIDTLILFSHKFLPIFLMPTAIALGLVTFGLIFSKKMCIWVGIIVLGFCSMPLFSHMAIRATEGWEVRKSVGTLKTADVIVVLSGSRVVAPGKEKISEWVDADRFFAGVEVFNAQKAPYLIFTNGGTNPWEAQEKNEGEILREYAEQSGVPRKNIFLTDVVLNTEQEASSVARLLSTDGGILNTSTHPKVILITSAFHMRRAQYLFESQGMDVIPYPVDFQSAKIIPLNFFSYMPTASALEKTELALREFYGYFYYYTIAKIKSN